MGLETADACCAIVPYAVTIKGRTTSIAHPPGEKLYVIRPALPWITWSITIRFPSEWRHLKHGLSAYACLAAQHPDDTRDSAG